MKKRAQVRWALIVDASFATFLAGQWLGLIEAGIVGEFLTGDRS